MDITFEDFIHKFYTLDSKISLELYIENDCTNIYDIHIMLLDLLIYGVEHFNLNIIDNLDKSIDLLQSYYDNINIKINIKNYMLSEFINSNIYDNRYIRFNHEKKYIINSSHNKQTILNNIYSIYNINKDVNYLISFSWKV